jgi:ATP synthase protein I
VTPDSTPSWEVVLFRASVWPTAVAGAVAAAVAGATRGVDGALGALLGCVLVVLSFGLGLFVARRTRPLHPVFTLTAAMMSYVFTVTALLLVLVLVRRTGAVDRVATGGAVLVCVLVWLGAEVRAFLRLPLLYVDPAAGDLPTGSSPDGAETSVTAEGERDPER